MQDAATGDCERFRDYNKIEDAPKKISRADASIFIKSSYVTFLMMVSSCIRGLNVYLTNYIYIGINQFSIKKPVTTGRVKNERFVVIHFRYGVGEEHRHLRLQAHRSHR